MNQLTRREFLKKLSLLPVVTVLLPLPEAKATAGYSPSLAYMEAGKKGLEAMVKAMQALPKDPWANLAAGIECNAEEILARTQVIVQAMIESQL